MTNNTIEDNKTKKLLIIEDEGEMCLLLNIYLQRKEMELDHVKTLSAAREYLQQEQPSVIILDNKLPDGMGVDFISYIRHQFPDIKIVMISGYPTAKDVALNNGAHIFLEKPFTRHDLYHAIMGLLN